MQSSPETEPPFTVEDLVQNFERIALFDEYTIRNGQFFARQTRSHLRRWESPVRVGVLFGETATTAQILQDRGKVTEFTHRLATLTNLDMRRSNQADANFLVVFLNAEERVDFAQTLPDRFPDIDPAVIDAFANSPRSIFCAAVAFTKQGETGVYDHALILVKSEHSNLMRQSCIQEEMAQAMGLTNDSPFARPSIFNDTKEFAYLTKHDEILLQMLYDTRLNAGMIASEVSPLLPAIAREALGNAI